MQKRYSAVHQLSHWGTAFCIFAILPLAWVMTHAKGGTPFSERLFNWHKTLGAVVLALTVFRIVWRFIDKPPPYPPVIARWDRGLSHAVYWLLYLTLLWMPITGLVMTEFEGYPTKLFNLIATPQLWPKDDHWADVFSDLHAFGQWFVYGLAALHIAGVAFHLIWGRDGVLGRMLPPYSGEPPAGADGEG